MPPLQGMSSATCVFVDGLLFGEGSPARGDRRGRCIVLRDGEFILKRAVLDRRAGGGQHRRGQRPPPEQADGDDEGAGEQQHRRQDASG